jgi:uncharacterized membrane protein
VKVTLIGGLLVVLPLWVSLLLLFKAIKGAMTMLLPIAKLLPQTVVHEKVTALVLLLLICFAVGLLIRTELGKGIGDWLEQHLLGRLPGFSLIRGMIRQFAGEKDEQSFQPALVEIEEALVRHLLSRNTQTDSLRYSSPPARHRWPAPFIFCNPNVCIPWMCLCAKRWSA